MNYDKESVEIKKTEGKSSNYIVALREIFSELQEKQTGKKATTAYRKLIGFRRHVDPEHKAQYETLVKKVKNVLRQTAQIAEQEREQRLEERAEVETEAREAISAVIKAKEKIRKSVAGKLSYLQSQVEADEVSYNALQEEMKALEAENSRAYLLGQFGEKLANYIKNKQAGEGKTELQAADIDYLLGEVIAAEEKAKAIPGLQTKIAEQEKTIAEQDAKLTDANKKLVYASVCECFGIKDSDELVRILNKSTDQTPQSDKKAEDSRAFLLGQLGEKLADYTERRQAEASKKDDGIDGILEALYSAEEKAKTSEERAKATEQKLAELEPEEVQKYITRKALEAAASLTAEEIQTYHEKFGTPEQIQKNLTDRIQEKAALAKQLAEQQQKTKEADLEAQRKIEAQKQEIAKNAALHESLDRHYDKVDEIIQNHKPIFTTFEEMTKYNGGRK